jgi:hypothetical protein
MVSVQLRNAGEGLWRALTLPTSIQLAQTLAGAVKTLNLADDVQIQPTAAGADGKGQLVDLKV